MTQRFTFRHSSVLASRGAALVPICGVATALLLGACGGGDTDSGGDTAAGGGGLGGTSASFGTGGSSSPTGGSGQAAATGGRASASGGIGNTGGANSSSAVGGTGGLSGLVDDPGGLNGTGGRSSVGGSGTGGMQGTGGRASSGGGPGTGGEQGTGGPNGSGGGPSTGGIGNTGGHTSGTGGVQSTGGRGNGTGGMQATGGEQSTGGVENTGGNADTGGTDDTGGAESAGGNDGAGGTGNGTGGGASCSDGTLRSGFYVENGKLYDDHCREFILRGVNYPYAWYTDLGESRFGDMASVGCNVVRVVLATGAQWTRTSGSTVSSIISWAKSNKMVAVLEVHDSTGWGDSASNGVHPDDAVAYWTSQDILGAIRDQEPWVIINIANEAFGNDTSDQWATFYQGAVVSLRNAGIRHTLMVDAPNWGQDWTNTMRDGNGPVQIFQADPDKNVVFSVHMYDVYGTSDAVWEYFENFLEKGLPLVIGEFAADHGSSGNVDEDAILAASEDYGVGYMGWSWSGNGSGLGTLDITNNFDVSSLSTWGDRLINGTNGIRATAKTCGCYDE